MATPFNSMRLVVGCVVAAAMLAACGGSQMSGSSVGMTPPAAGAPVSQRPTTLLPSDQGGNSQGGDCQGDNSQGGNGQGDNDQGDGGCISVTPHSVDFTASNPGPFTVTVHVKRHPNATVSEKDNCGGASGIATVTQGTGDQWIATAGALTGSCTATFTLTNVDGKTIGHAKLKITNSI